MDPKIEIIPANHPVMIDDNFREFILKRYRFEYEFKHYNIHGDLMWHIKEHNIVMNQGLQNAIDTCLLGTAPETDFYFELANGSPTFAAGDTPASHGGWTENQTYTEGTRQVWNGVRSGQSVGNSASPAVVTITSSSTFGGSALVSNNVKGNNADGVMFSGVVASQGNQTLGTGTLTSTYTITAADDGA